jgi:amino acid adenylation domain-containing protein
MAAHYNKALFSEQMMTRLLNQYITLLKQIAQDVSLCCGAYPLDEVARPVEPISAYWAGGVIKQFEQQVLDRPTAIAIDDHVRQWTYQQLFDATSKLANRLVDDGIGEGDFVGIVASRQTSLVIAILAVLRTGAAYFNVSQDHPVKRIMQQLDIAAPKQVLLCQERSAYAQPLLSTLKSAYRTLFVNEKAISELSENANFVTRKVSADQLACITFTSGSTGIPKAVMGTHQGLSGYLQWFGQRFELTCADRFSLLSGLTHDPLQRDIFGALGLGATLVTPDPQVFESMQLGAWVDAQQITVTHITPAMTQVLCSDETAKLDSLRLAVLTGERLRHDTAWLLQHKNRQLQIVNSYGATETQRAATYYVVGEPTNTAFIPIGTHSLDTRLRLFNALGVPCAIGEVGDIYLESHQMATGYLAEPSLSAEKFTELDDGVRRYQTGDLGVYSSMDTIQCLGRSDDQVALRGFRIELGEIEHQLAKLPQVYSCVVLIFEETADNRHLVAYVTATEQGKAEQDLRTALRDALRSALPDYMVPSFFVLLDKLPLTANGKLDKRALPAPDGALLGDEYVAPTTDTEQTLVQIWAEQFDIDPDRLSVKTNYFDIGGNSLSILKSIARMNNGGIQRSIKQFYGYPTIAELGALSHQSADPSALALESILPLNEMTQGQPLYLFHPGSGRIDCYIEMAAKLSDTCPVLGVHAPSNYGHDLPFTSMLELAEYYKTALKLQQPDGPYRLAGWSFGGTLAYLVAYLLTEDGECVDYLAVMDSPFFVGGSQNTVGRFDFMCTLVDSFMAQDQGKAGFTATDALPPDLVNQSYEQQLKVIATFLVDEKYIDFRTPHELALDLKFIVSSNYAQQSFPPLAIAGKSVMFMANDNKDPAYFRQCWYESITSQSVITCVDAGHMQMLEGESFEQIIQGLREDLVM